MLLSSCRLTGNRESFSHEFNFNYSAFTHRFNGMPMPATVCDLIWPSALRRCDLYRRVIGSQPLRRSLTR